MNTRRFFRRRVCFEGYVDGIEEDAEEEEDNAEDGDNVDDNAEDNEDGDDVDDNAEDGDNGDNGDDVEAAAEDTAATDEEMNDTDTDKPAPSQDAHSISPPSSLSLLKVHPVIGDAEEGKTIFVRISFLLLFIL